VNADALEKYHHTVTPLSVVDREGTTIVHHELIDRFADDRIACVPFFPLGGMGTLQSSILSYVARLLNATTAQVALAWLLRRAPNMLLIPGTSSATHLRENISAAELNPPDTALEALSHGASIVLDPRERD
jgi:pyridoxine 4-dehydrogenase